MAAARGFERDIERGASGAPAEADPLSVGTLSTPGAAPLVTLAGSPTADGQALLLGPGDVVATSPLEGLGGVSFVAVYVSGALSSGLGLFAGIGEGDEIAAAEVGVMLSSAYIRTGKLDGLWSGGLGAAWSYNGSVSFNGSSGPMCLTSVMMPARDIAVAPRLAWVGRRETSPTAETTGSVLVTQPGLFNKDPGTWGSKRLCFAAASGTWRLYYYQPMPLGAGAVEMDKL